MCHGMIEFFASPFLMSLSLTRIYVLLFAFDNDINIVKISPLGFSDSYINLVDHYIYVYV